MMNIPPEEVGAFNCPNCDKLAPEPTKEELGDMEVRGHYCSVACKRAYVGGYVQLLDVETTEQRQFRLDMEKAKIEVRQYSGRGMYGKMTYAVACKSPAEHNGYITTRPTEHMALKATSVDLTSDSLGKGSVLYVKI